MAATAPAISQLSCFSSINRRFQLQSRSIFCPIPRSKSFIVMTLDERGLDSNGSQLRTNASIAAEESESFMGEAKKSHVNADSHVPDPEVIGVSEPVLEQGVNQQTRAAKIHDFCFGIPYGGIVLSGGLIGFIFSRNPTTLLFGGALLALSTFSLKIWRQGKSSLPFILGQAALAGVLLWKNIEAYSLTKKPFPAGFYAVISAAMLSFYTYVVISGGNPPPKKKLKLAASEQS
ncbi:hypothetical protein SLE2022_135690 [Rubroshorea leprosula]